MRPHNKLWGIGYCRFQSAVWAVILFLLLISVSTAHAQEDLYTGFYWIDGRILPPPGVPSITTEGRTVVFYETDYNLGYASDVSGPAGLSGRSGEFMLNAMEDWRLNIAPGTYQIATIRGADNYGVDPVAVTVSGNGFDTSPDLVLAYGAGITSPEGRPLPPVLAQELPRIETIWFDGRIYQKGLVARGKQVVVAEQPKIDVKINSGSVGIDTTTLSIRQDEGTANAKTFAISSSHFTSVVRNLANTPIEVDYTFDFGVEGETLTEGDHTLKFTASNSLGSSFEVAYVTVIGGPTRLVGTPLTYPSPLRLSQQNQVVLQYGLSKDANIDIYIFDPSGQVVKKFSFDAGSMGGTAGGDANPNKVIWDTIADQGTRIGTGIYVWTIIDRDSGKNLGYGKLAAAP